MTDIVERLRIPIPWCEDYNDERREAADEIERLHQEVATLREMQQNYRDEIVLYLREIGRLKAEITRMKLDMRPYGKL